MSEKYTELTRQGQDLRECDPEKALSLFKKALNLAVVEKNEKNILETLFDLGVTYHNLANHSQAASIFQKALSLNAVKNDLFIKANILRCYSVQLLRINKIEEAVKILYESERVSKKCSYDENLHMVESTFGSLYIQLKMYDKALEHELKSLELAKKINIPASIAYSHLGIGSCYYLMNEYDNARIHLNKVLEFETTNYTKANTYYYLSKLSLDLKQYDEALSYAIKGHKIASDNNILDYCAICLGMIGKINVELGNYTAAIKYLTEATNMTEEFENKRTYFTFYKDLVAAYGKIKDYKNQAEAYEKLYKYHTEYLEHQSKLKVKQLNSEHQIEKAKDDAEIEKLKNVELKEALDTVKKLNDELAEANREKNDFMAVAVHDLKNPLQNILSTARVIKATNTNKELRDFADNIVFQTDRMFTLIRRLLDHNAIEQGNVKITETEFKAERICREILNDFNSAASKKNQNITYENNCNGDILCTDYDILYQIIGNIVSNAVKFSQDGKNITLKSYTENGSIIFEIDDEGPGFTSDDMKKVFRKFSRLSAKPTNGEHSTGLGLSITKKLGEMINADINLETETGKGSKFSVKVNRKI